MHVSSNMKADALHPVVPANGKRRRPKLIPCILIALAAAALAYGAGARQLAQLALAIAAIGWPASLWTIWAISRDRTDVLAECVTAAERRADAAEASEEEADKYFRDVCAQRDNLQKSLTEAHELIRKIGAQSNSQIARLATASEHQKRAAFWEMELSKAKVELHQFAREAVERRTWRTLPQGYDIDTEQFAAAVASALK